MEILLGILVILVAYFVKGFSGFGPALIIVPFFALIYDPPSALVLAALFDFLAGCILVYTVRKKILWSFVLSIFFVLAIGAFFGALLLERIPVDDLRRMIGGVLFVFSLGILFQKNGFSDQIRQKIKWLKYPAALLGGFLGGLVSMSGPPIIIYMKMMYEKTFFRTQLIAIFVLGTAWRTLLFFYHEIPMNVPLWHMLTFFIIMLLGLWLGGRLYIRVNELVFNRIIAIILFIPAINLLFG
jgi:uncharacterized membrane protein YfcA